MLSLLRKAILGVVILCAITILYEMVFIATNPLTGGSALVTASASITFAFPAFGWTTAQKLAFVTALTDTLADADVTVTNLLNFNS
jgi:hypothetical protein